MESTNASNETVTASAQDSTKVVQLVAASLSAADLITRAQARLTQIAEQSAAEQSTIETLADAAARGNASDDTFAKIGEAEQNLKTLAAERASIEERLVPLRAAIAKVRAEEEAAAAAAERVEATKALGTLVSALVVSAQEFEDAVAGVSALAKRRRELKKQFRDALNVVVRDPQPRGAINAQAEGMFTETPNLDQFISLDAALVVGSASLAADRAQKVRDRIAEATD